jgi:pimeloyl-ACP methyl ester carboxylesterase
MASMATQTRDIYLTANGLRHHVIARGDQERPIVMLIHGLTQQAHVFDAVATELAKDYHVYCLDVRGRGESAWGSAGGYHFANYVADLEGVREGLGIPQFALVGTSMGGLISMYYAAAYPERVTRLAMNDIGPDIDPSGLQRILTTAGSAPEAFQELAAVARYYREENAPVLAKRSEDEVIEYARWHVRRNDLGVYVWKMDPAVRERHEPDAPQPDTWESFKAIRCPLLILRGSESDILTPPIVEKMVAAQPGAQAVTVSGVGHAPSLSEPEAMSALKGFLTA